MTYKITKYKGKTKIKNSKTGESAEIDIEKFMKGGYKKSSKAPKYSDGSCGPDMIWDDSLQQCVSQEDYDEFDLARQNEEFLNTEEGLKVQRLADTARKNNPNYGLSPDELIKKVGNESLNVDLELPKENEKTEPNYNIANPYEGVDIPSAANILGESIQSGNTLGIVAGSAKVALGLGRNIVSGMGRTNRNNQTMKDYFEDQKNKKNPIQYYAYGGKKDEELATGEFMHGVFNENTEDFNAEVEKGEYLQTNEGDISEIVGDKHSDGGEKIKMEVNDRVLSDKLKLGGKQAKMLSEKYDLKLKSKNTYSDVLDKFRKKMKLDKLIEEESEILKKIGDQQNVEDNVTKNFNIEVLNSKKGDIEQKKHPIEEQRKEVFEELFNMQENSKPKDSSKDNTFEYGGKFESLAKEYGISIEKAKELIEEFSKGGKKVPKYDDGVKIGDIDPKTGKKVTKEEAEKNVKSGEWEDLGDGKYVKKGTPGTSKTTEADILSYKKAWDSGKVDKNKYPNFELFKDAAIKWNQENPNAKGKKTTVTTSGTPDEFFYTESDKTDDSVVDDKIDTTINNNTATNKEGLIGNFLFPDQTPLPPSSLQGTVKIEPRYDRVRGSEIDIEPYLQDIKDREESQIQNLEGLSANVRAAVLANVRANSNKQESSVRNRIDTANINSEEKAIYTNATIQQREENSTNRERLMFENRQYKAQSLTDNDLNNYYNQLQTVNKQKFMDIHNLNLINATNEDVYFDGQNYRRKNSDRDILRQIKA